MTQFLLVMLGGALGAASRFGLGLWLNKDATTVSLVNIVGSFVAVSLFALLPTDNKKYAAHLITGFCGAFTTYSAFLFRIS